MPKAPRLNFDQARAVTCEDPRVLCLAAAGSGKTTVLVERIVYLIGKLKVDPRALLAITFTNKAAGEMRERLEARIGERAARRIRLSTFHSWAARTVRLFAPLVGRTRDFTIYDEPDRELLYKAIAHQLGVKTRARRVDSILEAARRASRLEALTRAYQSTMKRHNAFDFEGLIGALADVLDDSNARADIVTALEHVLVDEYQDTSQAQNGLLRRVRDVFGSLDPPNLFLVGDEMQSIYGFRGADIDGIRDAALDDAVTLLRLPTNYRSTAQIIAAGNAIARAARSRLDDVTPGRPDAHDWDRCIEVIGHDDDGSRAQAIAESIISRVADGDEPDEIMVLARRWAELRPIAERLHEAGVPHTIPRRDADSWETPAARWIIAALRVITNPSDALALRRVAAWPTPVAPDEDVHAIADTRGLSGLLEEYPSPRLRAVAQLAETFTAEYHLGEPLQALHEGLATEVSSWDARAQLDEAVAMFQAWIKRRIATRHGVEVGHLLMWTGLREIGDWKAEQATVGVRLLTIHAAKGLEAPIVFVTGMDDGGFPRSNRGQGLEEERRLFYVAVTRAQDLLSLHWASRSWQWGRVRPAGPSPFLTLLPPL